MAPASLWFKQVYVADILAGRKTDTIRQSKRLPKVGDVVAFTVGPRTPFAYAEITKIEVADKLTKSKRAELFNVYGALVPKDLVRISFVVVKGKD